MCSADAESCGTSAFCRGGVLLKALADLVTQDA